MLKSYKYRLDLSDSQKTHIDHILGCCRLVYNLALETRITVYQSNGSYVSGYNLCKQLTDMKQQYRWLYDCPKAALQHSIFRMDGAFSNFLNKKGGFPNFRKKKDKQSFHLTEGIKIDWNNNKIQIPKIRNIKFFKDRKFDGKIKSATVSKTSTEKYFISILIETNCDFPTKKEIHEKTTIGLDMGIRYFFTDSFGNKINNHNFLNTYQKRIKREQRKLRRRYIVGKKTDEQSKSWKKQKLIVSKIYEKIANQRNDFLHKLSYSIVKNYDTICVENLDLNSMIEDKSTRKYVLDLKWSVFIKYLKYKSDWYGKNFIQIDRWAPTSKTCYCGTINKTLKSYHYIWTCSNCGSVNDRDLLAAKNIKRIGLGQSCYSLT